MQRIGFFLFLSFMTVSMIRADEKPKPIVDERVELLSIVFRLAGAEEYSMNAVPSYGDDIDRHFESVKNHEAVRYAKKLRSSFHVGQDTVMSYAVRLEIRDGKITFRDDLDRNSQIEKDFRWTKSTKEKFLKLLNDFYTDSQFRDFFDSHQPLYEGVSKDFAPTSNAIDYDWFKTFFGVNHEFRFQPVVSLLCDGGFGPNFMLKSGGKISYAVIGLHEIDMENIAPDMFRWITHSLVHEGCHAFCNPLIDKHYIKLKPAAERIFPVFEKITAANCYGMVNIVQYELLVRAATLRYWKTHGLDDDTLEKFKLRDKNIGFFPIDDWYQWLEDYENSRDRYPTLDDFMPEIARRQNEKYSKRHLKEFDELLKKVLDKQRPKITAFQPASQAEAVDPGTTKLTVTFDQPMRTTSYSWCRESEDTFPEGVGNDSVRWSEDRKSCTLSCVLKPGRTYRIWINDEDARGFLNDKGVPCWPTLWIFTTTVDSPD